MGKLVDVRTVYQDMVDELIKRTIALVEAINSRPGSDPLSSVLKEKGDVQKILEEM